MQVVAAFVAIAVLAVAWWLISPLFIDEVVEEDFPRAAMAVIPDDMTAEEAEEVMMEAEGVETMVTEAMPEAEEPDVTGPVALAAGAFMDADDFHRGSGEVTAYRLEDGSLVLRLEDIEVTNGPDLRVLVAPGHGIDSREALQAAGYIELAPLKGNIGSQNYDFPADYQVPGQMTVIIYCKPFQVIFATAELS
ncbi:MAG: DM13 domain-containing protein [Acidimicrobiia bacterium]|nr:DM13 domain-containing protein [Acidimicrobiia bacterium]MYD40215.1 DM13 domain-containing protein [Acidimicrobiia bacterium]MYG91628.1 DM13 domain-containing protein [Acidimicrobiia bacterium]